MQVPNTVSKAEQIAGLSWHTEISFNKDGRCHARVEVENHGNGFFEGWFKEGKIRRGSVTVWLFDVRGQLLSSSCSDNYGVAFGHRKVIPWTFNVPVIHLERVEKVAIVHSTDSGSPDKNTVDEALNSAQSVQ